MSIDYTPQENYEICQDVLDFHVQHPKVKLEPDSSLIDQDYARHLERDQDTSRDTDMSIVDFFHSMAARFASGIESFVHRKHVVGWGYTIDVAGNNTLLVEYKGVTKRYIPQYGFVDDSHTYDIIASECFDHEALLKGYGMIENRFKTGYYE